MIFSSDTGEPLSSQSWPWLVMAIVLLGVATSYSSFHVPQDTYRFLFVFDITQSMNVDDLELDGSAATRLVFSKSVVETALRKLPCGSEAGLAIFTEHRTFVLFTPVEVCEHYRALNDMLTTIDWRMAWAARSEIAKGLYSAIEAASQCGDDVRLVFLTDGHEAPPVHEDLRPAYDGQAGSVAGFIAGIGRLVPSRIPHIDENDNIVGYWQRDEVMQVDVYSLGRTGTEPGEAMAGVNMADVARRIALGQEHLSSLRETYLQELATKTGLDYRRIDSPAKFVESLRQDEYARRTRVLVDLGWVPASLAFICLMYGFGLLSRRNYRFWASDRA